MFKTFKYLELARHHVSAKTKKVIQDYMKQNSDSSDHLSETVFSAALSLIVAYLTETYFIRGDYSKPIYAAILFVAVILIYLVAFWITRKLYQRVVAAARRCKYNHTHLAPDASAEKIKELIDDFDHIAFDNLLIAFEFIEQLNASSNKEVATFYFHEVIYYLRTSVLKTLEITIPDRREKCLNIFGNTRGVDVFRLFNAYNMMQEISDFLTQLLHDAETKNSKICVYNSELQSLLAFQINELRNQITEVNIRCLDAKNDVSAR